MDKLQITANGPLRGKIKIGGAKNSVLKLMAASILTDDDVHLTNVPYLTDVTSMVKLLTFMGGKVSMDGTLSAKSNTGKSLTLNTGGIEKPEAPYDIVKTMRASAIVLGPLLAKYGRASVSLPGGCAIDARPLNVHISELEKLGAKIEIKNGYIEAEAPNGLKGAEVDMIVPNRFGCSSVGATETLLMASSLAEGTTTIINAALEPGIGDLIDFLNKMGAKITGRGTTTLIVEGVKELHGCTHNVIADRIEAATYAVAAVITGGEIELLGANLHDLGAFVDVVKKAGGEFEETENGFIARRKPGTKLKAQSFEAVNFPGVATDVQAQLMALMCVAEGECEVAEKIFENRFMHVPELDRLGADIITVDHSVARVKGVKKLTGCNVMATDLRASACLVLAGLVAEGTTTIDRIYHLDRGYECIEEKLGGVGAKIKRIK